MGLAADRAGIRMPPSERLEEIGALATLVDENRLRYGLDALCAWRGLPGKDETPAAGGGQGRRLRVTQRRTRSNRTFSQLPAQWSDPTPRPTRSPRSRCSRDLNPVLDREGTRAAYRLDVDLLPMVQRCAAAAFASIRAPPNRRAIYCCKNATPRSPSYRSSSAAPSAWLRSRRTDGRREPSTPRINYPRTRKATHRSRPANSDGWPHIPLAAAADRDRQQVRQRRQHSFSKATSWRT